MIRVIFLKKEISKNLKIARGNLQLISHLPKSMSGTTVILGSKYPKLHHALAKLAIFGPKIAKKKVWLKMLKIVQFFQKSNKNFLSAICLLPV